ncbi:MAG: hypothetical protein HUU29_07130 [Planctomycetaceae bacterium]|nr:hypothetical protein [Planctomycetaceae bacterium]
MNGTAWLSSVALRLCRGGRSFAGAMLVTLRRHGIAVALLASPSLLAQGTEAEQSSPANLYWAGALFFGLLFFVSLAWSIRPSRERQRESMRKPEPTREAVIAELQALERDHQAGRLPATAYLSLRDQLIERMADDTIRREMVNEAGNSAQNIQLRQEKKDGFPPSDFAEASSDKPRE